MNYLANLLKYNAYSLKGNEKETYFKNKINSLTLFHFKKSAEYRNYLKGLNYKLKEKKNLKDIPFLPVRLFKEHKLISIKKEKIFKTLYSSGTSSLNLSKIFLDKYNALNQIKVLQKIFFNVVGNSRLPMLIVDKKPENIDRNNYNASIAAINGFSIFANEKIYLLDHKNEINYLVLKKFLKKNFKKKFLVFGLTSNIYLNLIEKLDKKKIKENSFINSVMIHGGGWKKIENRKLNKERFNYFLNKKIGIKKIINYYGLVEQIGSIFFECKCGYFIPSNFSDVLIRDANLDLCKKGEKGIVQLISLLPTSYPGHSILTEDIGEIVKKHNCKCYNTNDKRFLIHGRLKDAELRGCSDI